MIEVMTKFFVEEFGDDTVPLPGTNKIKTKSSVEERDKTSNISERSSKKKKSRKSAGKEQNIEENQFGK